MHEGFREKLKIVIREAMLKDFSGAKIITDDTLYKDRVCSPKIMKKWVKDNIDGFWIEAAKRVMLRGAERIILEDGHAKKEN